VYLANEGALSWQPPGEAPAVFDEFHSDPKKPVPYTATITTGWHAAYMVEDQRFASRRPDVLVYRSAPLDEAVTVVGPLVAELWVSTTGGDADWVVKLVDEYPGRLPDYDPESADCDLGHSERLVRSEIFRGRYRAGYDRPTPFTPGEVARIEFPLQDVFHTFARGHRIQVQIQSSLFPFFDRNPQSWVPNIFEATRDDFIAARHRVYRSADSPSALRLRVLPGDLHGGER
jgi:putative CocE/NonD family hydrolase